MRPCLMLLVALCAFTVEATRNVPSPSALRRSLWWSPAVARRQARAGIAASSPTPAKGPSDPGRGAGSKAGPKAGAPEESPGQAAHADAAGAKGQQSVRFPRGARQYDVPQIECPSAEDGMERFACPSADRMGRYRCIDDHVLCDGFIDCPQGEDEDRMSCMFYKTTKAHLDVLADALLRWARGRY